MRPAAYLYNLMLWAEVHGGTALSRLTMLKERHILIATGLILALVSFLIFNKRKRVLLFSVFTTGFSGMSFVLAALLAYQAIYGYVYEMIGALSAFFMLGLWGGTLFAKQLKNPPGTLLLLETMTILLAVASPVLFKAEFFFYGLIFISGMLTGGQFSAASLSFGEPESGGTLYAIDLFGSFLGAIVPSIIIIPLFGISHALLFVAFVKLFSAVMIARMIKKTDLNPDCRVAAAPRNDRETVLTQPGNHQMNNLSHSVMSLRAKRGNLIFARIIWTDLKTGSLIFCHSGHYQESSDFIALLNR